MGDMDTIWVNKIAIIANIASGKDTLADLILENEQYKKMKLGKYIRQHVDLFSDALGIPYNERRSYYQEYAESMRLNVFRETIWLEVALSEFEDTDSIVCADTRKFLEYDYLKKQGFTFIAIDAPRELREELVMKRDGALPTGFDHVTETQCSELIETIKTGRREGYVVENTGTYEEFIENCNKMILMLKEVDLL